MIPQVTPKLGAINRIIETNNLYTPAPNVNVQVRQ